MREFIAERAEDMLEAGKALAEGFKGGEIVLLSGDLGAGKTVFTKGIALGLGISDEVTSPTFAIHNGYEGRLTLDHFDFYRMADEEEARVLGLDESFAANGTVCVMEWWKNVEGLLYGLTCTEVEISGNGDMSRKVVIREVKF